MWAVSASDTPGREKAGGRVVLLVVLGLVLLAALAYGALYVLAGDKVPRGTTVAGVDIGGRTQVEAERVLDDELADRVQGAVSVKVGNRVEKITAADAGLSVDVEGSVAAAGGGRSWDPARLWDYFVGGKDLDAVVEVDDARMDALLTELAEKVGTPPRDGDIVFEGSEIRVVEPRNGRAIDPDTAREEILAAYLREEPVAELSVRAAQPDIDEADVQRALDEFANPAVSGPVTLEFQGSSIELSPDEFGPVLGVRPEKGALVPEVDEAALTELVDESFGDEGAAVDATVRLVNGRPQVVPGRKGVTYDPDDVTGGFVDLVTAPEGKRSMEVASTVDEPDFDAADAKALGIKEKVSSFTTYYPPATYRDVNIGRAAELIDGTVLKPGETFSLNDTVGERTVENGFTTGTIISNGIFKEDLGGGVSQMATTLFNAMFFAGLEDVEHKAHSVYIDRYPVGREATVAWGAVDLRFRNDTDHGVLIDAKVTPSAGRSQGVVTVSMWSTKTWDIETTTSDRYAFTSPGTQTLSGDDCLPNTGYGGFDVDVKRIFKRPGSDEVVRTETFTTTYIPSDTIICKP
nr:VanW family protein [Nocardioides sp. zg-DK7169]